MHLDAGDRPSRIDQRRPAVGDLTARHPRGTDLDQVREPRVGPGRLDVHDDEVAARLHAVDKVDNGLRARLEEGQLLRLADRPRQLLLDVDERLQRAVAEQDRVGHDVLAQQLRAGLDHHDRVSCPGDDEVELRVGQLADGRVHDELAVDPPDAHGADRALERDVADRERGRRCHGPEHVRIVLLVGGQDGDHDLDVVLVALGEQGADRPVGQAVRENGRLGRAGLALDETAGDLARGVHALFEVDREREEVEARTRIRAIGRAEHDRVTQPDGDCAPRETRELAGLDGQRAATEHSLQKLRHEVDPLFPRRNDLVGVCRPYWLQTREDPEMTWGPGRRSPSGGVRAVR